MRPPKSARPPASPAGAPLPGSGVVVGVDVGTVRVGVAASDPGRVLAFPVTTLRRDAGGDTDLDALAALVAEREAAAVVVGLPRTLAGREGPSVVMARAYAEALGRRVAGVPVLLADERLSTVAASRALHDRGVHARGQRALIDQEAAVVVLQGVLDGGTVLPLSESSR